MENPLISFYLENSRTPEGYTLEKIWGWSHEELEYRHDYIQWLFPLRERSGFNLSAPTIDNEVVERFNADPQLRANLLRSFRMMLGFYGFTMEEKVNAEIEIYESADFEQKSSYWLNPYNHNLLRITRILKSLSVLGCRRYAETFLYSLDKLYRKHRNDIGENTMNYWNNAVKAD